MKNVISIVFIINTLIFSQADTLLEKLDGESFYYKFEALRIIRENNLEEYIPELEKRIFIQETLLLQEVYLKTLNALNAANTYDFAIQYYNSIDIFNPQPYIEFNSKLEMKARIQQIFFKYGDYSKTEDIFTYLDDPNEMKRYGLILHDLKTVYENVPLFQTQALDWLLIILNESTDKFIRKLSLEILNEINYSEIINTCVGIINNENEDGNLKYFASRILFDRDYEGLPDILRDKINSDPSDVLRWRFASGLLEYYALPSDWKLVIDHIPNEPDEDTRGMFEIIVDKFIPPKPDSLSYFDLCTKLISYTGEEMYQYGWIANEKTRDYYAEELTAVKQSIKNTGKIEQACEIINSQILPQAEQDLQRHLITEEGYKFLHYYTIYIKEEIEKEFGPCP